MSSWGARRSKLRKRGMRHALLALSLVTVACGGAAATKNDSAVVPTAEPSASTAPPTPSASTSASSSTTPAASASAAPHAAFCPPEGKIHFVGGQGTSIADAIKIVGAKGEVDGTASEYTCLDAAFGARRDGKWKPVQQSLLNKGGKSYDLLSVQLADGSKVDVYFDITDYFGKF